MAQGIARPDLKQILEQGGNLEKIQLEVTIRLVDLLEAIFTELKIQSAILVEGLDTTLIDPEDSRKFEAPTAGTQL